MSCSGWSTINPVCQVKDAVSGAADSVASGVFSTISDAFASAAAGMVSWLWGQMSNATAVDLTTSDGLKTDIAATSSIAVLVAMSMFLIQVMAAIFKAEPGGSLRAARGLGIALVGAVVAVACTQILLGAVDALSNGVVQFALGTNIEGMGKKLLTTEALTMDNPAAQLLIALVVIAAVVIVWCALMIRKMLIIISAVFAPIAFSGAASDLSRSWVKKWIEFTVALVMSKLILVIIFMIGLSVLNGAGQTANGGAGQKTTQLAIGSLTLLLAGLAPWVAIKFVHFAGDSFQQTAQHAGQATAGAGKLVSAPQKVSQSTQTAQGLQGTMRGRGGGGGAAQSKGTAAAPNLGTAPTGTGAAVAGPGAAAGGLGPAGAAIAVPAAVIGGAKSVAQKAGDQAGQASQSGGPSPGASQSNGPQSNGSQPRRPAVPSAPPATAPPPVPPAQPPKSA